METACAVHVSKIRITEIGYVWTLLVFEGYILTEHLHNCYIFTYLLIFAFINLLYCVPT